MEANAAYHKEEFASQEAREETRTSIGSDGDDGVLGRDSNFCAEESKRASLQPLGGRKMLAGQLKMRTASDIRRQLSSVSSYLTVQDPMSGRSG